MAKSTVPVNFKDDIINSAMGGKRRYRIINNSDGTISLEDVTTYDQVGSTFGAAQMNVTNAAVNAAADAGKIIDDIDAIRNVTKVGYIAGALALKQVDESLEALSVVIDTGVITDYTSITVGNYKELQITFNKNFKNPPVVFCTFENNRFVYSVTNITTTECKVYPTNVTDGTGAIKTCKWVAIGN